MSEGYITHKVTVGGPDLVMHNGQTSDPLNAFSKRIKEISGKRKKTDADHALMSEIEFEAGLYINAARQVIIPSRVMEAAVCEGARKTKEGRLALSGMFIDTDLVLQYDGGPLELEDLRKSADHILKVSVRVGQARVMRTRPFFQNWSGSFLVSLNSEVANAEALRQWITNTGAFVGLGDWRPRHGRFSVLGFEAV